MNIPIILRGFPFVVHMTFYTHSSFHRITLRLNSYIIKKKTLPNIFSCRIYWLYLHITIKKRI